MRDSQDHGLGLYCSSLSIDVDTFFSFSVLFLFETACIFADCVINNLVLI